MPTKTERGNRVFPVSDHSSDVIAALSTALRGQHVEVLLHTKVNRLLLEKRDEEKRVTGVELADHTKMHADAVIVATGGISYPSTGATGTVTAWQKRADIRWYRRHRHWFRWK